MYTKSYVAILVYGNKRISAETHQLLSNCLQGLHVNVKLVSILAKQHGKSCVNMARHFLKLEGCSHDILFPTGLRPVVV